MGPRLPSPTRYLAYDTSIDPHANLSINRFQMYTFPCTRSFKSFGESLRKTTRSEVLDAGSLHLITVDLYVLRPSNSKFWVIERSNGAGSAPDDLHPPFQRLPAGEHS